MLTIEQVRSRIRHQKVVNGKLLTSTDGEEWIRVTLTNQSQLDYYLSRISIYGFIQD
ncbi:hypothetical protein SOV_50540 [Sporomusa ovata DSM 2662]|uniref:hypothetical protein n=1 Tax=Sporomusa ovata TaxID=2378 RepID=UPI0003884DCD|nr:hypothetical protein [Sporomusa ovata]EQB27427.1 hypothetical protein SOV_2c03230 [Sporomusa ovata DSM 2662]